jgi:uncharacterized protein YbjT (DUF2867 family)
MARVAVLGATGQLGEILVNRALASGHQVFAFDRNASQLPQQHNENLSLFLGDAASPQALEPAVSGCRFVISAFDPQRPEFMTNLVKLLKSPPLTRFIFISRLGVGDSLPQAKHASGILSSLRPRVQRQVYEDFAQAEGVVRASVLPWVILRATALDDDAVGREVVVADGGNVPPSRVARADLAKFIMKLLNEPGWDRREVTVGTKREG